MIAWAWHGNTQVEKNEKRRLSPHIQASQVGSSQKCSGNLKFRLHFPNAFHDGYVIQLGGFVATLSHLQIPSETSTVRDAASQAQSQSPLAVSLTEKQHCGQNWDTFICGPKWDTGCFVVML